MATRIVDIHPHIISPDTRRYPIAPLGGEQSGWSATRPATFEQYIAAMDEAGIDKAAIVHSSTTYGFDNSYVADCVATQPKKVDGVFSVDILAADAPQKIRHWVERGLGGLRIFTTGSTMPGQAPWLEDPRLLPGWETAGDLGLSISVQMTAAAIPQLEKLLARYPKTPVIVDHMLKPNISEGPPYAAAKHLFDLARFDNVGGWRLPELALMTSSPTSAARWAGSGPTSSHRRTKRLPSNTPGVSRIGYRGRPPSRPTRART